MVFTRNDELTWRMCKNVRNEKRETYKIES